MIRRVGDRPDPERRYRLRAGVYAILPLEGHLLLTRQAGSKEPLQLPGGGVDPGEQPLRALHREVFEETGWRIGPPVRVGAARRFVYMPQYRIWAEKLCTIYLARPVRPHGPPSEAGHDVEHVPVAEAGTRLSNPVDRAMLALALSRGDLR